MSDVTTIASTYFNCNEYVVCNNVAWVQCSEIDKKKTATPKKLKVEMGQTKSRCQHNGHFNCKMRLFFLFQNNISWSDKYFLSDLQPKVQSPLLNSNCFASTIFMVFQATFMHFHVFISPEKDTRKAGKYETVLTNDFYM